MKHKDKPSFVDRGGIWLAIQAPVMLLGLVIPIWTRSGAFIPNNAVQWFGVELVLIGLALAVAGALALGDALTPFPVPRAGARLRLHGVYGLVRHPIYSGVVFAIVGWSIWCLSWPGLFYSVIAFIFFDRKAAYEESWLRRAHLEYADYLQRVKRLIPWVY